MSDEKNDSMVVKLDGSEHQRHELYQGDRAIESPNEDRFGRAEFARRIAQVIAKRQDAGSIVVGIYGPWGDGKTSVLNMVGHFLNDFPNTITFRFNPWRFSSEDQLLKQ